MSEAGESIAVDVNPLLWSLLAPVRWYVRRFPLVRGKGVLVRQLIVPALPADGSFLATIYGGGRVRLRYRETLGLSTILYGSFEQAELEYLCKRVVSGMTAIDVGANVGLYSVALGHAVGPQGRVLAIEPLPENVDRLRDNLGRNGLVNVRVYHCAVADVEGELALRLADDPAYASIGEVGESRATGEVIRVRVMTLDEIWRSAGAPPVVAIKLDIEGGEMTALGGARELLVTSHPLILIEAHSVSEIAALTALLAPLGYQYSHPSGFLPWNHIFL